jgi:hypothetical protein
MLKTISNEWRRSRGLAARGGKAITLLAIGVGVFVRPAAADPVWLQCDSQGGWVALGTSSKGSLEPRSDIFVWEAQKGALWSYDFNKTLNDLSGSGLQVTPEQIVHKGSGTQAGVVNEGTTIDRRTLAWV